MQARGALWWQSYYKFVVDKNDINLKADISISPAKREAQAGSCIQVVPVGSMTAAGP